MINARSNFFVLIEPIYNGERERERERVYHSGLLFHLCFVFFDRVWRSFHLPTHERGGKVDDTMQKRAKERGLLFQLAACD